MVKLTPELIEDSYQYMNPIKEYELNLRGLKIPVIENLGATLNQFDTIDFTDNDIRRLDGFPILTKLKSMLFNNNRIQHIADHLELVLPNLENLVLTNNNIEDLEEVSHLKAVKSLKSLSLLRNPVSALKHYRLFTIYKLPQLRVLDFKKIKLKEKQEAQKLFKGKKVKHADKPKTFVPGEVLDKSASTTITSAGRKATKEEMETIRVAIQQVNSIEEMEQLQAMLKSGIIPSIQKYQMKTSDNQDDVNMVENDDE